MLGQDRNADAKQTHSGRTFLRGRVTAEEIILAAALASRAENQDTIDLAVLGGVKDHAVLQAYHITHFQPFDPVHKRTEAAVKARTEDIQGHEGSAAGNSRISGQCRRGQGRGR